MLNKIQNFNIAINPTFSSDKKNGSRDGYNHNNPCSTEFKKLNLHTLQGYYLPRKTNLNINFGFSLTKHLESLGAVYDSVKNVTKFGIWISPEKIDIAKGIEVHVITPEVLERFPFLKSILKKQDAEIPERFKEHIPKIKLAKSNNEAEIFEAADADIPPGSFYRYSMTDVKGNAVKVKDPRSLYLPHGINGWSQVVDDNYRFKFPNPKFSKNTPAMIYEMHIGTNTEEGTFSAAARRIQNIAKKGFNHIQIMPPVQSYNHGWGYGALPWATSKELCGEEGINAFKKFVDECHKHKIKVIVDINHNHFAESFDGNKLASYQHGITEWGEGYNYKNPHVRNFVIDDFIRYAKVFNVDGFRMDSIHTMTNGILRQINLELKGHARHGEIPEILLVGESYKYRPNETHEIGETDIEQYYGSPEQHNYRHDTDEPLGFDAIIGLDSHILSNNVARNEVGGLQRAVSSNIENIYRNGSVFSPYPTEKLIYCLSTHDDLGDTGGIRLLAKSMFSSLDIENRLNFDLSKKPDSMEVEMFKRRISANITQQLLLSFEKSNHSKILNPDYQRRLGITKIITLDEFKKAYTRAKSLYKTSVATFFMAPSRYRTVFQGDEMAAKSPFKFFIDTVSKDKKVIRDTSDWYLYETSIEKGFKTSQLPQSEYPNFDADVSQFFNDMLAIHNSHPGMFTKENLERIWHNDKDNVLEIGYKMNGERVFAVINLGESDFKEYGIQLTKGRWKEAINSNARQYGESGQYLNSSETFETNGKSKSYGNTIIKLPKHGVVILKTT